MQIASNRRTLVSQAILLVVLWLVVLFILVLLSSARVHFGEDAHFSNHLFIYAVLFIATFLLLVATIGFIKFPKVVRIDKLAGSITLSYMFRKDVRITAAQIEAFSAGYLYIGRNLIRYKLIQLVLADGKNQVLTEFDLSDIYPIIQFLEKNQILNLGEAKFNYFKYVLG